MCLFYFLLTAASSFAGSAKLIQNVGEQLIRKDSLFNGRFPVYTKEGKWVFSNTPNWFAGFTAGELWYMYEITGDEKYKTRALVHCDNLIKYSSLSNTHDLGFIFFNSCVKAYKHTGEKKYRDAAIEAARMLLKRFNEKGNFIRAWGELNSADREGLMIIDSMMNLELLFWAAEETGGYLFYDAAYKHAITCLNQHIRKDFSSYHVIEFNPKTGDVIKKKTHQGYGDETTWARGEAWGVYGFALAYKYTGDKRFFNASKKMADYFINHLPDDYVPYWDFDLKGDTIPRDASAAAIASSGMFLLSDLVNCKTDYDKYLAYAKKITSSLAENYLYTNSKRPAEEGILLHTVYNYAKGWGIDESFPCGDFYFVECLQRAFNLEKGENFINPLNPREDYLINNNWFYLEENINNPEKLYSAVTDWQKVSLPHTWNKSDALDEVAGYRRGTGWYRKEILIPKQGKDINYILHFEGVNNICEVFVNGKKAGGHIGGYVGFDINITPFVVKGEKNVILVKADNSFNPDLIPSQKSDFLLYGGITRNVHLRIIPVNNITNLIVQTPKVTEKSAAAKVKFNFNSKTIGDEFSFEAVIKDKEGKIVSEKEVEIKSGNPTDSVEILMPSIKKPNLWSPQNPYLYSLEIKAFRKGKTIDQISEVIGFRWYEFKEKGAFFLNGKRLLLRGTHRHEELSGYGNALPDSIHRKDIQMIKDLGANFVRLAHYPQAPEVYKACDELGLLVWDENPWCRGGIGGENWKNNTRRIFKEMIFQNYNHPSIILWSIGNECDWMPDFANGDNDDALKAFAVELHKLAKELDPYRLTTTRKFPQAQSVVDVFSPSIWSGWYSDVYKNYEKALLKARDNYKRLFHAEFGGDSHVGRHTDTPINGEGKITQSGGEELVNKIGAGTISNIGDWSESYIVDLFDWYLHVTENLDWFAGSAQWIFRDFTTPLRPENPIPYVNQKGLVDMANNPKDAYYVFKSYWTENPKFCYIESHTWTERSGKKNEKKELNVFSNCKQVELFLNGVSQGRLIRDTKKFPACGLSWQVVFNEGGNNIIAVGYDENNECAKDTLQINYSTKPIGKPDNISLTSDRLSNGKYLITAYAVDAAGNHCTNFNKRVYFAALSGGRLLDNLGIPLGSSVIEMANGKAQILFEHIPLERGVVEVRNQDFKGTYLVIE